MYKTAQKIKLFGASLLLAAVVFVGGAPAQAADFLKNCTGSSAVCENKDDDAQSMVLNVIDILLYIVGALSVIVIIYGGIKYVTSTGDEAGIKSAKNAILYAVIGLILAIMSFGLVKYVGSQFV